LFQFANVLCNLICKTHLNITTSHFFVLASGLSLITVPNAAFSTIQATCLAHRSDFGLASRTVDTNVACKLSNDFSISYLLDPSLSQTFSLAEEACLLEYDAV
jgi:hypothetical protein